MHRTSGDDEDNHGGQDQVDEDVGKSRGRRLTRHVLTVFVAFGLIEDYVETVLFSVYVKHGGKQSTIYFREPWKSYTLFSHSNKEKIVALPLPRLVG